MKSKFKISAAYLVIFTATVVTSNLSAQVPTSQPSDFHRLRFSLVAEEGEAGQADQLTDPDDQKTIRVFTSAVLTEQDMERVHSDLEYGQPKVSIRLTQAAGEIFHQFTSTHLRRRIAIILDGKIVSAATIQSPIGREVMMTMQEHATPDDMDRMVESLEKSLTHTTTRPAGK